MVASFEAKMRSKGFRKKERSTLGKIRGWRRQLLVRQFPIHYHPNHFQAPAHVNFEVAVHEPYTYSHIHQQLNWFSQYEFCSVNSRRVCRSKVVLTWVVSKEANSHPSSRRHAHRVPLNWVYEIEFGRILL